MGKINNSPFGDKVFERTVRSKVSTRLTYFINSGLQRSSSWDSRATESGGSGAEGGGIAGPTSSSRSLKSIGGSSESRAGSS